MKKITNLRFPYPFLEEDGGDYLDSSFIVKFYINKVDNKLELRCIPDLKCKFIENLIEKEDAMLVVHIEQRTYRRIYKIKDTPIEIPLDELSPNFNIELVGMVIANKEIKFSYSPLMNEVYQYFDGDFVCGKASILGYSNFEEFELPQDNKISSIFTISEYRDKVDIDKGEPFKIDLDGNVIDIKVMPKIKEGFLDLRIRHISYNKLLNSIFVYPAIQFAIMSMFNHYDNYKDYKWCIAVANKLENHKECTIEALIGNGQIDKDELIEFTHIILEDLLLSAFEVAKEGGEVL